MSIVQLPVIRLSDQNTSTVKYWCAVFTVVFLVKLQVQCILDTYRSANNPLRELSYTMVIMYDSSSCVQAPSSLSAVYDVQYVPPGSTMYPGMVHTSQGTIFNQEHVGMSPYLIGGNAVPSVSTCHSSGPLLATAMTSYPSLTSYPDPYSYPSLTSGLGSTPRDVTYTAINAIYTTKATDIPGMDIMSRQPRSLEEKSHKLPYYWRKKTADPPEGMTRTRDKYRVVYSSKQRAGLEKEYKNNKFLTCARRSEISESLDLSERQIKIWFQNRRAKERRQSKRSDETNRMSSPEMSDKRSEISGDDGVHTGAAISPNHDKMDESNADNAQFLQFTAHARHHQYQEDNTRPSCLFAFRPIATVDEQPFHEVVCNKTNSVTGSTEEYDHAFNYGKWKEAAYLTSSPELQPMNSLMTSYNISPIGVNTDPYGLYRM